MKRTNLLGSAVTFTLILLLGPMQAQLTEATANTAGPIDPDATAETKALFNNLRRFSDQRFMFGHQHTTCYGIGWEGGDTDRSDVKTMTGSHPAVYGWDMGHTGTDHMDRLIIDAFERGGINTISWHMGNLITGERSWDVVDASVSKILPGASQHHLLKKKLDEFAEFALSLKDRNDRLVPIIFRPWHEHTGGWFWWGSKSCTPEEYNRLWRFTVSYLRDTKNVHNLLYAISPSGQHFSTTAEYESNRFPGYEYIDVVGFDMYVGEGGLEEIAKRCAVVTQLAAKHGKIAALTEFGYRNGLSFCDNPNWYMDLLAAVKSKKDASGIVYALTWRNGSKDHFWVPYQGHANEKDFKRFARDKMTVFEKDLPDLYRASN